MAIVVGDSALLPLVELLRNGPPGSWTRATFSHPGGEGWERVVLEPVATAAGRDVIRATFVKGDGRSAKTIPREGWPTALESIFEAGPRNVHVAAAGGDWHARRGKRRWLVSVGRPSRARGAAGPARHDRAPGYALDPADAQVRALLFETGIAGKSGQVRGEAAGKHRQLQHFLELLRPLRVLRQPPGSELRILDAGCGSAHLGFALYLWARRRRLVPNLLGVDRNELLIERVTASAARLGYERTQFLAAGVSDLAAHALGPVDLVVALHLCDTATDDALLAGVRAGAPAIVVAPCCQHELIPQLEPARRAPGDGALLRHGALRERMASLLTDELRLLALEASGYRVDPIDFTGPENTGKNLMLRAERPARGLSREARAEAREQFAAICDRWDVLPSCARLIAESEGTGGEA